MNKRKLGADYEKMAALFLQGKGYDILHMNYRCRYGEADIVAKEDGYFVFVEVKYRGSGSFGLPERAVDYKKKKRLTAAANDYLQKEVGYMDVPCRFDVVAILGKEIHLIKNAFDAIAGRS